MSVKVSIVMPIYNVAEYIRQSLDCLIHQTLKEIEIICVDDESSDNSVDIIKEYINMDSRIILRSIKHSFAGGARNEGLKIAKGDYIIFLDPDDYFDLNMIEILYNQILKDGSDVLIAGVHSVFEDTIKYNPPSYISHINTFFNNKTFSSIDIKDDIWFFLVYPYNKICKRDFLLNNEIQFQSIQNTNDASFSFEILIAANKISLLDKGMYYYRHFRPNNTRLTKGNALHCVIEAYEHSYARCQKYSSFSNCENGFKTIILSSLIYHLNNYAKQYNPSHEFFYNYIRHKLQEDFSDNPAIQNLLKNFNFYDYNIAKLILKNDYINFTKYDKGIFRTEINHSKYCKKLLSIPLYKHKFNSYKEEFCVLNIPIYKIKRKI